jgi:GAF domain-containing protein
MEGFLGVPIIVAGEPFGNLYLTDKEDGGAFTDADEKALVLLGDLAGVAIDHARRYSGSEAQRDELEHTVAALDATVSLARLLAGQTDLGVIVELVAKRGRALISARALVIELLRDDDVLDVAFVAGAMEQSVNGRQVELKGSAAEIALQRGRPLRLQDELSRARMSDHGVGRLGLQAQAALVVPLASGGRPLGVLVALDRLEAGPRFTADDERVLEAFAVSAAASIATAQLVASQGEGRRGAATAQERARWARKLDDETLPGLVALGLGLSEARRSGDAEVLCAAVDAAVTALEDERDGLHALIAELRPRGIGVARLDARAQQWSPPLERSG